MRFWDSSAVVPLIVAQPASPQADAWLAQDPQVTLWTLTAVELTSALQRLVRDGGLDEKDAARAEARADEFISSSHLVIDIEGVKLQARRLLKLHPLRAADALQLAAALEWANGRAAGRCLHTLGERLARAAMREGFEVIPNPFEDVR